MLLQREFCEEKEVVEGMKEQDWCDGSLEYGNRKGSEMYGKENVPCVDSWKMETDSDRMQRN
jgi:hypothetical protein